MIGLKIMKNIKEITDYLDLLIPNPKCELNYNKDYELLIAVMLSAQTTDKRVNEVTKVLFEKYPTLNDLSKAELFNVEEIIKPLGNYHKKSKGIIDIANILLKYNSVPNNREILENLPMVGRKTTNVVLSILFNEPNIAVDTHVARVSKRLNLVNKNDNVLQIENKLKKLLKKDRWSKTHHQLVLFGRYYCKAKKPLCDNCKLKDICIEKNKG